MFNLFRMTASSLDTSSASLSSSSASSISSSSTITPSPPTHPIQIGFTPGGTDALPDLFGAASGDAVGSSHCAFPSWPKSDRLFETVRTSRGAAYISDEELFDLDEPAGNDQLQLYEQPQASQIRLAPLLPRASTSKPKGRKVGKKIRRTSKPMTPIQEASV